MTIQIPLFEKQYTQQALSHYNLRTVPVPYHINARLSENMEPSSYTWRHPKHQLPAMSYSTYIPLDIANIDNCFHLGTHTVVNKYSLPNSVINILVRVLYIMSYIGMLKQICNFTYYPSLILEPTVLDFRF